MASNGLAITNLTSDALGNTNQQFVDVAWDNVGNLYALNYFDVSESNLSFWRVYSPPGSNQATTVAVSIIQALRQIVPPQLFAPVAGMGRVNFTLRGQSNVTYVIQQSIDLVNWMPVATNYSRAADRSVSIPSLDTQGFYRAVARP
jgi:hypothetical protein